MKRIKKSNIKNYKNGYGKKNLKSKYGEIEVNIPRDSNSTFEPKLVKKVVIPIEN